MASTRGRRKGCAKTGGRKKGTPNVKTALGEDKIQRLVETMEEPTRFDKEFQSIHGKDFFKVYFDAQTFLRPRFSSVEFKGSVNVSNEVVDKLMEAER